MAKSGRQCICRPSHRVGDPVCRWRPPRRLRLGRVSVYVEPRDFWIGVYVAEVAIYVCPVPMLVFRWIRKVSV